MSEPSAPPRKSVLLSFKFVTISVVGSLTMALVCTFAPIPGQIEALGACLSILSGLFVSYIEQEEEREKRQAALLEKLKIPLALAPEHELFENYDAYSVALSDLAKQIDPVLRQYATLKLAAITEEVRSMASGKVVFSSTETWRTVYESLLQSPALKTYKSVSWVKTRGYWRDQPGKQSMRINFQAAKRGVEIERIVILGSTLWGPGEILPVREVKSWIEEQRERGIKVSLVRESEIGGEAELLSDFGIYGDRATGIQEMDEQSRTLRFILLFDKQSIKLAEDRWARLSLYATPYADLLAHQRRQEHHVRTTLRPVSTEPTARRRERLRRAQGLRRA
jgi:hypothetical protein